MDELKLWEWLWLNMADDVLVPAIKERLVVFGTLGIMIRVIVNHTKTKIDDEFLSGWRERFLAKKQNTES